VGAAGAGEKRNGSPQGTVAFATKNVLTTGGGGLRRKLRARAPGCKDTIHAGAEGEGKRTTEMCGEGHSSSNGGKIDCARPRVF